MAWAEYRSEESRCAGGDDFIPSNHLAYLNGLLGDGAEDDAERRFVCDEHELRLHRPIPFVPLHHIPNQPIAGRYGLSREQHDGAFRFRRRFGLWLWFRHRFWLQLRFWRRFSNFRYDRLGLRCPLRRAEGHLDAKENHHGKHHGDSPGHHVAHIQHAWPNEVWQRGHCSILSPFGSRRLPLCHRPHCQQRGRRWRNGDGVWNATLTPFAAAK